LQSILILSQIVSAVSFFCYGLALLTSNQMVREFERYGLQRWRRVTGALQLAGSLGLTLGFFEPALTPWASAGLALQMGLGVAARVRVGDRFWQLCPALFYLLLNSFVLAGSTALLPS
jgi:hypothetical protein